MIKKFMIITAIIAVAVAFVACDTKSPSVDNKSSSSDFSADLNDSKDDYENEDEDKEDKAGFKVFDDEDDDDYDNNLVKNAVLEVDGKKLSFPMTVKQLLDIGFAFEDAEYAKEMVKPQKEYNNNFPVDLFYNNTKTSVQINLNNLTDNPISVEECVVASLYTRTEQVTINGIAPERSTYSDICNVLGVEKDRLPDLKDELKRVEEANFYLGQIKYIVDAGLSDYYPGSSTLSSTGLRFQVTEDDTNFPIGTVLEIEYFFYYD